MNSAGASPSYPRLVPVSTVRDQLVASLREAVNRGELRPGQRLIEREICEQTGASRTVVREALRLLQGEGVVQTVAQKGCIVTPIERRAAEETYEMRCLLEGEAARLFRIRANAADFAALDAAFAALAAAYATSAFDEIMRASKLFDAALFAGCGNELLGQTTNQLSARISYLRWLTVRSPGRTAAAGEEYQRLYQALRSGTPEEARDAAVHHVRASWAVALAIVKQVEE